MSWILTAVLFLLLAGIVVLNVFHGRKRGMIRTGIAIGVLLISALIAVLVSRVLSSSVSKTIVEALQGMPEMQTILNDLPSLASVIAAAASMLMAVTIFFLIYYVLRGILNLIVIIVLRTTSLLKKEKPEGTDQLVGTLLGGLLGVLIFCVFSMPMIGYLTLADDAMGALLQNGGDEVNDFVKQKTNDEVDLYQIHDELLHPLAKSPMVVATGVVTNPVLFSPLTVYQVDGERVTMRREVPAFCRVAGGVMAVGSTLQDTTEINDRQLQIMDTLADDFGDSAILCRVGSEFLCGASSSWLNGETFMGVAKPSVDEMLDPTLQAALEIFKTSDAENIEGDLRTVLHVLASLARSQVLEQMDQFDVLLQTLGESGVVEEVMRELGSNERMAPLVTEISNLGIRALASVLGIPADASAQYQELMNELANAISEVSALPEEERAAALADRVTEKMEAYGVDVPEDIANTVSEAMLEDFAEGEITSERVQEFFKVYAASSSIEEYVSDQTGMQTGDDTYVLSLADRMDGMKVDENGIVTLPDGTVLRYYNFSALERSGAYRLRNEDLGNLGTLCDAASMVSCIVTLEDLLCIGGLSPENAEQEAAFFQKIVNEAAKIATLIQNDAETEEILEAVGGLMDAMSVSEIVGGENATRMMTAILQSDSVTGTTGFTPKEAEELSRSIQESAKEEGGSYTGTMKTVSKAVSVVKAVNDDHMTDAEREARVIELMENLTPASASALEKMSTVNMMKAFGVPEKNAPGSADMAGSLFLHLADYAKDHDDYAAEAGAVNLLFHMALSCKETTYDYAFSDPDTGRVGRTGKTAYVFVQTMVESTVVSATMNDVVYRDGVAMQDPLGLENSFNQADRAELIDAIRQYASAHPTEEVKHRLSCVAALTNLTSVSDQ